MSSSLGGNKVSSTYLIWTLIKSELTKSETTSFSYSVIIIFIKTSPDGNAKETMSFTIVDSVFMGSSLGLILANIIMSELENIVVSDLIDFDLIKFYIRYVDDTVLFAKEDGTENIENSFDDHLNLPLKNLPIVRFIFWILKLTIMKVIYFRRRHTQDNILNLQARCHEK